MANHLAVTPGTIANSLEDVLSMLKDSCDDPQIYATCGRILKTAARNIHLLFELKISEDGKFRPENAGQIWYLVDIIMRSGCSPDSYDNDPAKIFIGVQKALEIGVEPITGLSNIMIINKRPTVWGDLAQALIQRSGKMADQIVEKIGTEPAPGTELPNWPKDFGWRVTTIRVSDAPGYPQKSFVGEYTVADAVRANLWMNPKKKPWISDPSRMLFNRARAFSQRDGFSDCLFNMGIAEEQDDIRTVRGTQADHKALSPPTADDDEPVTQIEHIQNLEMQDFTGMDRPDIATVSAGEATQQPAEIHHETQKPQEEEE